MTHYLSKEKPNMVPSVFVSYSHDSESHLAWVLQLSTRLRHNGVDAILDRWNLDLGRDVAAFIEKGLSKSSGGFMYLLGYLCEESKQQGRWSGI